MSCPRVSSLDGARSHAAPRSYKLTIVTSMLAALLMLAAVPLDAENDAAARRPAIPAGLTNIKHIIFMVQENRSADNYFGVMNQYRASQGISDNAFDGFNPNVQLPVYKGTATASPFHFQSVCHDELSPGWNETHYDVDKGKMDRFLFTTGSVPSANDPHGTRAIGYYDWTDLPFYYDLAFKFATSDRWFSPLLATTIPNRMYLFAATSAGYIRSFPAPTGGLPITTIFDRLTAAHVSWRYYYQDSSVMLPYFATWYHGGSGSVYNLKSYFTDVMGNLPQVVFIERGGVTGLDEHPYNNIQKGAADVRNIIQALMNSPNWGSSVFILTYDEGGGAYDHVPPIPEPLPDNIPPQLKPTDIKAAFNTSGFRVPLIVISPWVKPHFVSHVPRDYTAILKFIETRFGLQPLNPRDAAQDDMTEFFNFSAPAYPKAPNMAAQPLTGICNRALEKAPGF